MIKKLLAITIICCFLQGCLFIVGAAIGVTVAGAVVYDKRTAKESKIDKSITLQIQDKLNSVPEFKNNSHIVISSFNEEVLLAGQVQSEDLKAEAYAIAQTVPGVKKIYNELTIQGSASTISNFNDTWINTQIKTKLVANQDLQSSEIQVVTVDGVVYLMGVVTEPQAETAVEISQHVPGVQKVVKAFTLQSNDQEWS